MLARLHRTETVAPRTTTYWLEPEKHFRYTPGQFIELYLPHADHDERGERRWFTLSSSPSEPQLAVTTHHTSDKPSSFKSRLAALTTAELVHLSEPLGDFVLPKLNSLPLTFVAGGIGCTPFRSMLQSLKAAGEKRDISMLYAVRRSDDAAFKDLFSEMTQLEILQSQTAQHLSGERILAQSRAHQSALIYLSGPERMIEALVNELLFLGVEPEQIVTDYFHGYNE